MGIYLHTVSQQLANGHCSVRQVRGYGSGSLTITRRTSLPPNYSLHSLHGSMHYPLLLHRIERPGLRIHDDATFLSQPSRESSQPLWASTRRFLLLRACPVPCRLSLLCTNEGGKRPTALQPWTRMQQESVPHISLNIRSHWLKCLRSF